MTDHVGASELSLELVDSLAELLALGLFVARLQTRERQPLVQHANVRQAGLARTVRLRQPLAHARQLLFAASARSVRLVDAGTRGRVAHLVLALARRLHLLHEAQLGGEFGRLVAHSATRHQVDVHLLVICYVMLVLLLLLLLVLCRDRM